MKDRETRIEFKVIDNNTGREADIGKIALKEDWAKGLMYCDMQGFAILDDGNLVLLDECGKFEYCPSERFSIKFEDSVILSREDYESLKGCENMVKRLSKISPTEAESENKALKEELDRVEREASKKTAKKILDYFDKYAGTGEKLIGNMISEQRKKYGVGIKE